ncbi:MAG: hypothetical protein GEV04_05300 [Actinophytocola sp.]|nr:hypothetical protein [Actinophytocola sp.]
MHTSALDKVRQLRFEGYTVGMLALEIDLLREGRGTDSMSHAVNALASVAAALGNTDDTLRAELGRLGVEWYSEASSIAQSVMQTSADFAADATGKLNEASQAVFGLSEAFQRALNTLPDSQTLREGAEGLSTMDVLADLIGHETDHAAKVRAASVVRDQAVDALNQLASTCAEELGGVRQLGEPGAIVLDQGPLPPEQPDDGSEAGYQTMAAAAESVSGPVAPPGGLPTAPVNAGPPPSSDAPSGANTTTGGRPQGGSGPGAGSSGSSDGGGRQPSDGDGSGQGPGPVGGVTDPLTGSGGSGSGGGAATIGGSGGGMSTATGGGASGIAAGIAAAAGTPLGGTTTTLGVGGMTAELLPTGSLSGAMPQSPTQITLAPHGVTAVPLADADGIAATAVAVGAAGVAGVMSAEPERERRGNRYDVEDDTDETRHEFDVGVIEDEAEADAVAEIEPDAGPDTPAYLEHAAPHGPDDRVRTHGIDDADLFADDRMVARDTIGEDASTAYGDDRQDNP